MTILARGRRGILLASGVAVLALAVIGGMALFFASALAPRDPAGTPRPFAVPRGATAAEVAARLEREGLVRHGWAFLALAHLRRAAGELRAGEYDLSPSWGTSRILERLRRGHPRTYAITIPEGLTAREIADRLAAAGIVDREAFLAVVDDRESARRLGVEGPTLEGYLFPETYRFPRGTAAEEVARTFVGQFLRTWATLADEARQQGLSMREVVTLASIVEKETGVASERPRIAAVFRNRLARGMRLESDPTVIYGIPHFDGNLRRADLEDPNNPYNTYRIRGLPPTPISNPGAESLRAVLHPAPVADLYFVARGDGTHVFSRTYREHLRAVERYQRHRRRRSGSKRNATRARPAAGGPDPRASAPPPAPPR